MFSYKPQKDESGAAASAGGEFSAATSYYPGFPGFTSSNYDDFLYNPESFYDSTDLNSPGINPLYESSSSSPFDDEYGGRNSGGGGILMINAEDDDDSHLRERSAIA